MFTQAQLETLPFPVDDYDLTHKSTFLDIGSGFGKPVFHASMQTYCRSRGIEVVPARVIYSVDQMYRFRERGSKKVIKRFEETPQN